MSAHVPRKVFAKSFVVTVAALPAISLACSHEEPMSHNPPMPTETATATPSATPTATPSASPDALATSEEAHWMVTKNASQCSATLDDCPPNAKCNPPAPTPYTCPANVPINSYPLKVARAAGAQECKATFTDYGTMGNCPAGMHCNPPPPHLETVTVACPK